ncbi:MAG: hypothetical protein A2252_02350 [Elusimicrobia bacterium RIFOXYA2_FULL_39_19]|nr:MAG: hypothetical protein A2252_02350 [Elusimicrobia bacterium RIFOXYA2_FULL_39_19]
MIKKIVRNRNKFAVNYSRKYLFIFCALIIGTPCLAEYEKLNIVGETVGSVNGIFDPSIEYDQSGTIGWMSYSPVQWPAFVHTHLAKTTDYGQTWVFVSSVNPSVAGTVVSGTITTNGVWRNEVSTLVHDPDDPGKEWKLYWHKYFTKSPYGSEDRDFARGWIAYKYASDPAGPWSSEIPLFGAYPFPPQNEGYSVQSYLNQFHVDLSSFICFTEPGSIYINGVIYLSFNGFSVVTNETVIFLIASNNHGATWNYVGTLTDHNDAVTLGYNRLVASSLVEEQGRIFLLAAPYDDFPVDHDGIYIFEFEDISQAELKRTPGSDLIVYKFLAESLPDWNSAGESDYDEHNSNGGILMPQTSTTTAELFQIFNTHEKIINKYNTSGYITYSNSIGINQALVTLTGDIETSTVTDSNGYYQFNDLLEKGTYTITPSSGGYAFSPLSISTVNLNGNLINQNFTGIVVVPPETYIISGYVKEADSTAVSGVTMTLAGLASSSTVTDAVGYYQFTDLSTGSYTITPVKGGYLFSPAELIYALLNSSQTNQNYFGTDISVSTVPAPTYSISGYIKDSGNKVLSAAAVTLASSAGLSVNVNTDANGYYEFTNLSSGTYAVTPSKTGWSFSPLQKSYSPLNSGQSNQDFTATYTLGNFCGLKNNLINPLKAEKVEIDYSFDSPGTALIHIYAMNGALIMKLLDDSQVSAGPGVVYWDGKDRTENTVASGIYIVMIKKDGYKQIKKICVLK